MTYLLNSVAKKIQVCYSLLSQQVLEISVSVTPSIFSLPYSLNNRIVILVSLGCHKKVAWAGRLRQHTLISCHPGKSKIKILAGLVPDKGILLGLPMPPSCFVLSHSSSSYKAMDAIMRSHLPWTHLTPVASQRLNIWEHLGGSLH